MKKLSEVQQGQQFYFPQNRGTIFTLQEHFKNMLGDVRGVRATQAGKLYSTYLSAQKKVWVVGDKKETTTLKN